MSDPAHRQRGHKARSQHERGASLVEIAFALPLLVVLLFGVIEFGWAFAQNLEVKHIAREVARLAAVNDPEGKIPGRACDATAAGIVSVAATGGTYAGDTVTVTVTAEHQQLTGLFDWAFAGIGTVTSRAETQLEQNLTNWSGTTC